MAATNVTSSVDRMRAEKHSAALGSVVAAFVITALKFAVGLLSGSLGILSEAAHSTLDLVAAVVTLLSIRVSDKPADEEHTYGHGKFENFSAFVQTLLLLCTSVWIIVEAVHRLFYRSVEIRPSWAAAGVMVLSMAVDVWRSRRLQAAADKYGSEALHADALHFHTDIFSSAAVLAGLGAVALGERYGVASLQRADPAAALVVAAIVVRVSWALARQTVDALLDAVPGGLGARIRREVDLVPGVLDIDRVRLRRAGNRFFADLTVGMERNLTFQRTEQLVRETTDAVHRVLPEADVVVHPVPRAGLAENVFDRIRAVASRHNLGVHDVGIHEAGGRLHVEQHVELNETMRLREAHDFVTRLETEMRQEVPEITSILTHIESEPATIERADALARDRALESRLRRIAAEFPEIVDVHDVVIRKHADRLNLSCHCTMPDDLPLARVHDVLTAVEIRMKQEEPELFKVLIHPEPRTDNRR